MLLSTLASGCLWPTSLHDEQQPENLPPYITFANPPFGTVTIPGDQRTELDLKAIDPNETDTTLYVRLFLPGSTPLARIYTFDETTLTLPPDTLPGSIGTTERSGALFQPSGAPLCIKFPNGGDLYVRIADQKFDVPPNEDVPKSGAFVENYWTLDCH
jgi:hypothetical protein